jgi:hypothetical protein
METIPKASCGYLASLANDDCLQAVQCALDDRIAASKREPTAHAPKIALTLAAGRQRHDKYRASRSG